MMSCPQDSLIFANFARSADFAYTRAIPSTETEGRKESLRLSRLGTAGGCHAQNPVFKQGIEGADQFKQVQAAAPGSSDRRRTGRG